MKRTLIALLGGVAVTGLVSTAQTEIGFGIVDVSRNTYVEPMEFMTGLDVDGFSDIFDGGRDGFLGLYEINDREEVDLGVYDLNRDWRIDRAEYYGGTFNTFNMDQDGLLGGREFGVFGSSFGLL